MGSKQWAKNELFIIVYFASRNVDHQGCCKLLHEKTSDTSTRTLDALRSKLEQIRIINGLWSDSVWNLTEVDKWLMNLGVGNHPTLMALNDREWAMIAPVRILFSPGGWR